MEIDKVESSSEFGTNGFLANPAARVPCLRLHWIDPRSGLSWVQTDSSPYCSRRMMFGIGSGSWGGKDVRISSSRDYTLSEATENVGRRQGIEKENEGDERENGEKGHKREGERAEGTNPDGLS